MRRTLNILFDVRCLQDDNYRDRGVGRHSRHLIQSARKCLTSSADTRLVAITDAHMAPLDAEDAKLFDDAKFTAYPAGLTGPTWFIGLSPMTHDPLFVARLINDVNIFKACVVYDFIPLHEHKRYHPLPWRRVAYNLSLYWLSYHQLFLPISQSSEADLRKVLSVPKDRTAVTGVAIDPTFVRPGGPIARPFPAGYILAVGGGDPRKNVECALLAHARSRRLQNARIGLVVIGYRPELWSSQLRAVVGAAGGDPSLVLISGWVADDTLAVLYRDALCVIVPSQAEGFSLPAVEGMAAGSAVIASAIPAHQELISRDDLLFATEDDMAASWLLDRVVFDPDFRRGAIQSQNRVWRKFRGDAVADAFWSSVLKRAISDRDSPGPAILNHRPRIAFLTPLPPDKSGVADYSAASLSEIAKLADVHVFSETVAPRAINNVSSIQPLSALPCLSRDFDRVVSVVGNSSFHVKIFDYLTRYGGACIEHDNRLLGFYAQMLGKERATQQAERELGRALRPGELDEWLNNEAELKTLFLGELVQTCEPLCVHSRMTARLVQERYGAMPILLPFSIHRRVSVVRHAPEMRECARAALGIPRNEVAIVTFGLVDRTKAPDECIWALELLRSWNIPATLHFVGALGANARLVDLCRELKVEPYVKFFSDFVTEDILQMYLAAADCSIQLRTYSLGALSGALLDCIAWGVPTVANQDLADNMDAPGYVARVPDNPSPVLVAEAIANFVDREPDKIHLEAERRTYEDAHSMQVYARRLMAALNL